MLDLPIWPDTRSTISLQELEGGATRFASPDGTTQLRCGPAARPVRTPVLPAPSGMYGQDFPADEQASCAAGSISSKQMTLARSILKMCPVSRRGLPKSRDAWRALATPFPDPNERLRVLVLLISAGVCGLLPTVTARDGKNPGRQDHARLTATRGEPLPETFGLPVTAALAAWMMGYPVGWLTCAPSATRSTHGQRLGLSLKPGC